MTDKRIPTSIYDREYGTGSVLDNQVLSNCRIVYIVILTLYDTVKQRFTGYDIPPEVINPKLRSVPNGMRLLSETEPAVLTGPATSTSQTGEG